MRPAPLDEVWETAGSFRLTFDDGLRSFRELALPLSLEHRLPATPLVVSSFCGRARGWRSSPPPDGEDVWLDWEELRGIADEEFDAAISSQVIAQVQDPRQATWPHCAQGRNTRFICHG